MACYFEGTPTVSTNGCSALLHIFVHSKENQNNQFLMLMTTTVLSGLRPPTRPPLKFLHGKNGPSVLMSQAGMCWLAFEQHAQSALLPGTGSSGACRESGDSYRVHTGCIRGGTRRHAVEQQHMLHLAAARAAGLADPAAGRAVRGRLWPGLFARGRHRIRKPGGAGGHALLGVRAVQVEAQPRRRRMSIAGSRVCGPGDWAAGAGCWCCCCGLCADLPVLHNLHMWADAISLRSLQKCGLHHQSWGV